MVRKSLLKTFKFPNSVKCEKISNDDGFSAKFIAETFERGYATTIGNTFRRILRSSIQGWAISAIKIITYNESGAHHLKSEFEQIPGVVEDTIDLIADLKDIRFSINDDNDEDKTFLVSLNGPCELRLKDLQVGEIKAFSNKDILLTITENINLDFEFTVTLGRGYLPSEENKKHLQDNLAIAIDSIFSPIKNVVFSVESMRHGEKSNYERLILEITTDGSIKPEDALGEAAKIAKEQFTSFINFDEDIFEITEENDDNQVKEILRTPIEDLELTSRCYNCLYTMNIKTIGELIQKTEDELNQVKHFGKKSLEEIKLKLSERGLDIGIKNINSIKKMIKSSKENDNES